MNNPITTTLCNNIPDNESDCPWCEYCAPFEDDDPLCEEYWSESKAEETNMTHRYAYILLLPLLLEDNAELPEILRVTRQALSTREVKVYIKNYLHNQGE